MSKPIERVHNKMEALTLVKEAIRMGEEENYYDTSWETHSGEYLFHTEKPSVCMNGLNVVIRNKE